MLTLEITNVGDGDGLAEVLLDVTNNGVLIETFPLASSLTLPLGTTSVTQRYIPPTGWESGTWSFVVRLDTVDPLTGTAITVATLGTLPELEVD